MANQPATDRTCSSCGHDVERIPRPDLGPAMLDGARRWREFIEAVLDYPGGDDDLTVRPAAATWSAVEYACHVRDVLALTGRRVELATLADRPVLDPWDAEAAVHADHYVVQDPNAVGADLMVAAMELARLSQVLTRAQFGREATFGDRTVTVEELVRDAVHECLHHLVDATTVVPAPAA